DVAAAARRELLDDPAVRPRDHEHRDDGGEREEDREIGVRAERAERLVGAVRRRRQAVGAEPDPRQERDQRHLVEDARILNAAWSAEDGAANACDDATGWFFGHGRAPWGAPFPRVLPKPARLADGLGGECLPRCCASPRLP